MTTIISLKGVKVPFVLQNTPHKKRGCATYSDVVHDVASKKIVTDREYKDGGTCYWCAKKFDGYTHRIITDVYYQDDVRHVNCYGTFCSPQCAFSAILDDAKRICEYRNKNYTDHARMVVYTKQKMERDLRREIQCTGSIVKRWNDDSFHTE